MIFTGLKRGRSPGSASERRKSAYESLLFVDAFYISDHEDKKNSSEFFKVRFSVAVRVEESFRFFSCLLFPPGITVSPKSVKRNFLTSFTE
jgi:hypothetical protein